MRRIIFATAVALCPLAAHAHTTLDRATPAADTAATAPNEVVLVFADKLEPAFSTIDVRNAERAAM